MTESATKPINQGSPTNARAQEILDTATRLFYAEGYHPIGMRRIAKEIGIQTAAIYYYFPSKGEILYVICLEVTKNFVDEHLPILYGDAPAPELLKTLVRRHISYFWDHRFAMDVALRDHRILPEAQGDDIRSHRRRYQTALRAFVTEGAKRGDFLVADPRLAVIGMLDMINGINNWFKPGGTLSIDELATNYADMAVDNLLQGRTSQ